jgi:hypothetical protein
VARGFSPLDPLTAGGAPFEAARHLSRRLLKIDDHDEDGKEGAQDPPEQHIPAPAGRHPPADEPEDQGHHYEQNHSPRLHYPSFKNKKGVNTFTPLPSQSTTQSRLLAVVPPQTLILATLGSLAGLVARLVPLGFLDGPNQFRLLHGPALDPFLFGNFLHILHFHDRSSSPLFVSGFWSNFRNMTDANQTTRFILARDNDFATARNFPLDKNSFFQYISGHCIQNRIEARG